jgi:tyrosyl-tRNA synthetase
MTEILNWLFRGTSEIFPQRNDSKDPQENLLEFIKVADRPLRVKFGIDPTGSQIHLGHTIPIRKLRAFQDAGHTAVLIIGDFTAQIGDPTGKSDVRNQLTSEQVKLNAESYLDQLRPILDFQTPGRLEIHYNSDWLKGLNLQSTLKLLSTMTVGQMLAKEGFKERYNKENPIFLHEFMYPLMQGYDSVAINSDVELGGTDQKFNIAVGRDLQRHFGKSLQFGLLLPILNGTDGVQKMSKSLNNYVGLQEDALSMYAKLEKTPDTVIKSYFELLTDISLELIPQEPRQAQKLLALEVVSQYHGQENASKAQEASINLVRSCPNQGTNLVVPEFDSNGLDLPIKLVNLLTLTKLSSSNADGRRQIEGGAVRIDGEKIEDFNLVINSSSEILGKIIQIGKKKFIRII